jgi:hypothetical protein
VIGGVPKVHLKTDASGRWVTRVVAGWGEAPSLGVTVTGAIRIAYVEGDAQHNETGIGYLEASRPGGTFVHRTVREFPDVTPPRMALDSHGGPVIVWSEPSTGRIIWTRRFAGIWSNLGPLVALLGPYAAAVDPADSARIVAGDDELTEWILATTSASTPVVSAARPFSIALRAAFGGLVLAWVDLLPGRVGVWVSRR